MTRLPLAVPDIALSPLGSVKLPDALGALLQQIEWDPSRASRVSARAENYIRAIRADKAALGEVEQFLQHYPLSSPEGRALMTLAESLLRIPDTETADALIDEKLAVSDWSAAGGNFFMKAAGSGLGLARSALSGDGILGALGRPVIRKAMQETVRRLGGQFVLGEDMASALKAAKKMRQEHGFRCSFDVLGEGARTADDAERYFNAYLAALDEIGAAADPALPVELRHGMSVKLSALYPRYDWAHEDQCIPVLTERLLELAVRASQIGVTLTVDAEESDRLELSLRIILAVFHALPSGDWGGFGLAVQAYDRRCLDVIDLMAKAAKESGRRMQVRLVKGAYWDGEIKRAQVSGWPDYAVYQRKSQTDLSYLTAAQKLLAVRPHIWPMFATHNAHTAAAILDFAGGQRSGFECQRLHGMGAGLGVLLRQTEDCPVTVYAPVGPYEDLLPYLVRRMLENGANASFVAQVRNEGIAPSDVVADPVQKVRAEQNPEPLPLPKDLYGEGRRNSDGIDLSRTLVRKPFFDSLRSAASQGGDISLTSEAAAAQMMDRAHAYAPVWRLTSADERACALETAADLMENHRFELLSLLQTEGRKTLADALAELREAVDFCRYYAQQGRGDFSPNGVALPGPSGESNRLYFTGRGAFVCISPWNFPLAIFLGQITAALMAGNTVVAKPAEQTPKIAKFTVDLLHRAGIPLDALQLAIGDGIIGAALVRHASVAGVAFTGSTDVAQHISKALAAKNGPIVPLIAETGGQNAMIVDSTALPEQVVDDALLSAFGSAGQRCSALRVLCLQEDIADRVIHLLKGAMAELVVGDPSHIATDVGPVIDSDAKAALDKAITRLESIGTLIARAKAPSSEFLSAFPFVVPCAYEVKDLSALEGEVFGPVLHVVRYPAGGLERLIAEINSHGYGLTFGLHSRLERRFDVVREAVRAGNIYINRSMIGAVVGVQPFGGMGLSGTGPKAGGPHYLHRFATEIAVSNNVMASGGNIDLISRDLQ